MGNKILVPLSIGYGRAVEGLGELTDDIQNFKKEPNQYKLVLFTGGADVDPRIYGETSPRNICGIDRRRDEIEKEIFEIALKAKIKMTGICRGIQFLHAISGGKLAHHIERHAGNLHLMQTTNEKFPLCMVNSLHHQMVLPNKNVIVIGNGFPTQIKNYIGDKDLKVSYNGPEVEAVIIPHINSCGVQYHPELMAKSSAGYIFFYKLIENLLTLSKKDFINHYEFKHVIATKEDAENAYTSARHTAYSYYNTIA